MESIHARHTMLEEILIELPKCKDYPEWKRRIIAKHNKYHQLDNTPHKADTLGEFLCNLKPNHTI